MVLLSHRFLGAQTCSCAYTQYLGTVCTAFSVYMLVLLLLPRQLGHDNESMTTALMY